MYVIKVHLMLLFISGGLYKSVLEAVDMKAKAFGLFLKSQRQWACKPLEDKVAVKFRETYQVLHISYFFYFTIKTRIFVCSEKFS